jgi:ketosteroid isomerase-like protein
MSRESMEIVKANVDAFASRGLDGWMELFADDVEYWAPEGSLDDVGPIQGKPALRAWLEQWLDAFEGFWFEAVEFIDAGEDQVVVVERFGGRAKISGIETEQTQAFVSTTRDGKIVRCREFMTRAEALEAAGLSD